MGKYCTNCGSELEIGANFCPKCGNKVTNISETTRNQDISKNTAEKPQQNFNANSKAEIIGQLKKLESYFATRENQYNLRNNYINFLNTVKKPSLLAWIIGGGAFSFVFYFLLFLITSLDIGGIGFFGVWIVFTIWGYIHFKKKVQNNIVNTQNALAKIEVELKNHYQSAEPCMLAFDYSEPAIIRILINLLQTGRADNLKEAINVMLDDIHKQSMLNKQAEIAKNSQNAASAASATGLLVGISLLTKRR